MLLHQPSKPIHRELHDAFRPHQGHKQWVRLQASSEDEVAADTFAGVSVAEVQRVLMHLHLGFT